MRDGRRDIHLPARCGRDGVPLLYGRPGASLRDAAKAGDLKLAGCLIPEEPANWACARGHR